jgi:uncharacterized delta-60 repeat protein
MNAVSNPTCRRSPAGHGALLLLALLVTSAAAARPLELAWVGYSSGGDGQSTGRPGCGRDITAKRSMAVGPDGLAVVTGCSGNGFNDDYLTVKYDAGGAVMWAARHDRGGLDRAHALVIDGNGNVYVTGDSQAPVGGSNYDYLTIKYSIDGEDLWRATYNGSGNSIDTAYAIAVDSQGGVLVTGGSTGEVGGYNYATVKYSAQGSELWVAEHDRGGHDIAYAVEVDASDNVYVTGESRGSSGTLDYLTIKYSADGAELWQTEYNGDDNGDDRVAALLLDGNGRVYVSGSSFGSGGRTDIATVAYDAAGVQQWAARYDSTGGWDDGMALALDGNGNVHVAGVSEDVDGNFRTVTIKYDASGAELWAVEYAAADSPWNIAASITVDAGGNVHIAGQSMDAEGDTRFEAIKYSANGVQQWQASHADGDDGMASAVALDGAGNLHVSGRVASDPAAAHHFATIKYDPGGMPLWVAGNPFETDVFAEQLGVGSLAAGPAFGIDAAGNAYATGTTFNGVDHDFLTVKFSPTGNLLWSARYNGSGGHNDHAYALAIDADGNVHVTGSSGASSTRTRYATVKYDTNGVQLWAAEHEGAGNGSARGRAIAVDAAGNVHVTGHAQLAANSPQDYLTIKYDANGSLLWDVAYNGSGNLSDFAYALVVDAAGSVHVTGESDGSSGGRNYATVKYASNGVQQWAVEYNGSGNSADQPHDMAVDGSGNVYVTGRARGASGGDNFATVKYDAAGTEQWAVEYKGSGNGLDEALALALDGNGNVLVTGRSLGTTGNSDYATVKYNALGVQQWVAVYDGGGIDHPGAMRVDDSGNVFVTGRSSDGTSDNYATVKYDAAGVQQWDHVWDGPLGLNDRAMALALSAHGSLFVAGTTSHQSGQARVAVLKLVASFLLDYQAGPNGSISGVTAQTVLHGATGSPVLAVADAGYRFDRWSDGSTANPRTDSDVAADISVVAGFVIAPSLVFRNGFEP